MNADASIKDLKSFQRKIETAIAKYMELSKDKGGSSTPHLLKKYK